MAAIRHSDLFDTDTWRFKASFSALRDALFRAIEKNPEKWRFMNETKVHDTHTLFKFFPKGLLSGGRYAYMQVCQVSDEETEMRCKIIIYGSARGNSEDNIPMHEKYFRPEDPSRAREWRTRVRTNFRFKLAAELGVTLE